MTSHACDCAVLKERNVALQAQNEKLMAEIRKVKTENGTMKLLVKEMRLLREREPSESSEFDSAGEEDDDFVCLYSDGTEDNNGNIASENAALRPNENENDDPNGLELSDGEDTCPLRYTPTQPVWKRKAVWECANCQKEIRGERIDRLRHIIVHKKSKVSCPFDGCTKLFHPEGLRTYHIPRSHKVKFQKLPQAMKERAESERAKLFANAKKFERKFFPKATIREVFQLVNNKCKMCRAYVTTSKGQENHIAAHLNLELSCPVDRCNKRYELAKMYDHLRISHPPMSQAIKKKLKKARSVCLCAAAEARELFF